MPQQRTQLETLTIGQQAALTTGASSWETVAVPGIDLPAITVADGPHGLRHQGSSTEHLGTLSADPATCFPPAVTLACSWDPALAERVGAAIGAEAAAAGVSIVLGPGINITRAVRCGRNFEYFSEDPLIAALMGAGWVQGLQAQGIGASLKHFAVNNQETDRLRISVRVDERALHEIYLRAFAHIVRTQQPWTVMCAYNAINGSFAAQNRWLLTQMLREQWGFAGVVMSDWGAVHDRVDSLRAGLDLQMPGPDRTASKEVERAVLAGDLDPRILFKSAGRIEGLVRRSVESLVPTAACDERAHHVLAQEVAESSIVLLENDGVLPLAREGGRIAVVGEFAQTPRFQGAGSSQIVPTRVEAALECLRSQAGARTVDFAAGYRLDGATDTELVKEAAATARDADVVLAFLGLPDDAESEGFDRSDIELPAVQLELLDLLLETGTPVVVVLSNGSVVRVSDWAPRVSALVEGWLLGQAGGAAIARVLFGRCDPGGRLAQTIPLRLPDTPEFLDFPGTEHEVHYSEGIFVGYRWYDSRELRVSYPFGHGLSYTTFEYRDARVTVDKGMLRVELEVLNTGHRDGTEVVQMYVGMPGSQVQRAVRELRGFRKIDVPAGEYERVDIEVPVRELAYFSSAAGNWRLEGGEYVVEVGASSRDIRWSGRVHIDGDAPVFPITLDSSAAQWLDDPTIGGETRKLLAGTALDPTGPMATLMAQNPMRDLLESDDVAVSESHLEQMASRARSAH